MIAALPVLVGTALLLVGSGVASKHRPFSTLGFFKWGIGLVVLGAVLGVLAAVLFFWPRRSGDGASNAKAAAAQAPACTDPAITTRPVETTSVADDRIIVDTTPKELADYFERFTTSQAVDATQRYIGKWMRVSGTIHDVKLISTGKNLRAFVTLNEWQYINARGAHCFFIDKKWIDRVQMKNKGDRIALIGQIELVQVHGINLDNCELES